MPQVNEPDPVLSVGWSLPGQDLQVRGSRADRKQEPIKSSSTSGQGPGWLRMEGVGEDKMGTILCEVL